MIVTVTTNAALDRTLTVPVFQIGFRHRSSEVLTLAGPATRRIDLDGRTVTPGFIYNDGDNSVPGGDIYKDTQVAGVLTGRVTGADMEQLLRSIREVLSKGSPGEPIFVNMPKASPRAAPTSCF